MSRKKYILLVVASFFLPALITIAALAALKVTPFGNNTLLFGDSYYYYTPWLSYFTTVLKGEHSMYYSFSDGIGSNIALLNSTQLFHPISLFYLIAGWDYMPQAFSAAIIFDTSLCGLTMFLCLSGILGKHASNIIFSTSYALMGYMVVYNYNPLFHMGVVFLPLMVLGLVKLIEEKRTALYTISIAYTVLSGFQMGFIVCMASVFVFAAYLYVMNSKLIGKRKEIFVRYTIASVTGGFLGSIVWLPALLSCTDRIKTTNISDFAFEDNGPILQMAAKLFSGADSTSQIINGYPVIFCGVLTILLVILYFLNKEISKREKIAVSAILVAYGLSFYIKTFKAIFQGFSSNTWFNHRQSFVFSFFLLLIAAKEMQYIYELDLKDLKKALIILVLSVLVIFSVSYEFISGGNVVADLLILSLILSCYAFYRFRPERSDKRSLILIMLLCVSLQLYINYYTSEKKILDEWGSGETEFRNDIFIRQPPVYGLLESDKDFYRLEIEDQMTKGMGQDPFLFHYNGVGHATYSSYVVTSNLQKLGINWTGQKANSYGSGVTAATDSLLGIKYVISKRDLEKEKNYIKKMNAIEGNSIYENPFALDLLVVSNDEVKDIDLESNKDIFDIQNCIWKAMTGSDENIFIRENNYNVAIHNSIESFAMNSEEAKLFSEEMSIFTDEDENENSKNKSNKSVTDENGNVIYPNTSYIEISFQAARDGSVYMYDSAAIIDGFGTMEDALKYIGTYRKGEEVSGRLYFNENVTRAFLAITLEGLQIYYSDDSVLEKCSETLRNRQSSITKISDTSLVGDATVDDTQLIMFTIPYDTGWKLTVDGIKEETFRTADIFLSAKVPAGEHSFRLEYVVPGLLVGKILSIISVLVFAFQVFFYERNIKIQKFV
ncbi:YfhO family protein [Butyrivibrio sp. FCS014]|uniref:YfhO family protein n=1 Tax=Butyrivibrio sp. FCS014 TaxID=1408304 RepID=UPI0004655093|nr:YfhO family protein [Butyrivibrio sp. FCS014]